MEFIQSRHSKQRAKYRALQEDQRESNTKHSIKPARRDALTNRDVLSLCMIENDPL